MTVGYPQDKATIDNRAGSVVTGVRESLRQAQLFKAFLDSVTDPQLTALGYTGTEISQLRSSVTDLDKLRTIYEGTATQATTYDFRQFAKLLAGVQ